MGMSRAAMLWPGVPQLWLRGEVRGLLHAAWFACLFNGVWLATVAWPDLLGPWTLRACWFVVIGASIFAAIWAMRHWQAWEAGNVVTEEGEAQFEEAQTHYLRGDYFEAEAALHRIFTSGKQDVEAAILMVSILRRTKRYARRCIASRNFCCWTMRCHGIASCFRSKGESAGCSMAIP